VNRPVLERAGLPPLAYTRSDLRFGLLANTQQPRRSNTLHAETVLNQVYISRHISFLFMSTLMLAAEFDRPLSRLQFCVIAGIPTRLREIVGAVYTNTISRTNPRTICCKSDGYTILCTTRKYSVYTRYDFAYKLPYDFRTNPHTIWST
jgi:hypothetical protein